MPKKRPPESGTPAAAAPTDPVGAVEAARAALERERTALEQLRASLAARDAGWRAAVAAGTDTDADEAELRDLERAERRGEIRLAAREAELVAAEARLAAAQREERLRRRAEIRTAIRELPARLHGALVEAAAACRDGLILLEEFDTLRRADPADAHPDIEDTGGLAAADAVLLTAYLRVLRYGDFAIADITTDAVPLWHRSRRPFGPAGLRDEEWRTRGTRRHRAAPPPEASRPSPVHVIRAGEPRLSGTVEPAPGVQ